MASGIRGKVIKAPDATPGLLFVNGKQKTFEINGIWQSAAVAPASGMTVDVELDEYDAVSTVRPVSEADLAKEQAKVAMETASEKGKAVVATLIAKVGKPALIATALLIVSWFFLDYYSLNIPIPFAPIKMHPTFWQNIGFLKLAGEGVDNPIQFAAEAATYLGTHSDNPPTGFYGFLVILALAGPLLPAVWKNKRAVLGGLLPLLFTLLIVFQGYRVAKSWEELGRSAISQLNPTPAQVAQADAAAEAAGKEFYKALNLQLGLGFYVSILATLFLAGSAVIKYLALMGSAASIGIPVPMRS
jgi:hypothetical protein